MFYNKYTKIIALLMLIFCAQIKPLYASSAPIPRVIFAFYDKDLEGMVRYSISHRTLEMPLNWLGYHLEFYERNDKLPKWRDDVAGVVLSLPSGAYMPDMDAYVAWLQQGMNQHKKFLSMGNIGFDVKWADTPTGLNEMNKVLSYLGLTNTNQWVGLTYNSKIIYKDLKMVEYERKYPAVLPAYPVLVAQKDVESYLKVGGHSDTGEELISDLVTTNKNGGFVSESYNFHFDDDIQTDGVAMQRWLINPFDFLNKALGAHAQPRPDVTTLNGRRIFYSHLDGDGWNNYSEVSDRSKDPIISAQVLYENIYKQYKKIPFTVAPIVGDLDIACHGKPQSEQVARDIFALPNVEPASHTHSHPLMWRYFENMHEAGELKYLHKYPAKTGDKDSLFDLLGKGSENVAANAASWDKIVSKYSAVDVPENPLDKRMLEDFETPRSYACAPFDMDMEIQGSADYLQKLAPANKKILLMQWSGDTSPTESALRKTREAGLFNINGGDSRFDPMYASYSYVSPIGIEMGHERQIYSSNSNENTYTSLWSDNFFGFRYLVNTVRNTETPRRISPFNVYYHAYSGEKSAALQALKQNIEFASSQPIIPVFASTYARIANGFYSSKLVQMGENKWRIDDRGGLQTIRFDNATISAVDFANSEGVIGQKHYQGSLYVFLNPKVASPIIALQKMTKLQKTPPAAKPYLISSRWQVQGFEQYRNGLTLAMQGFGSGKIQLYWPNAKKVHVIVRRKNKLLHKEQINVIRNILKISLQDSAIEPLDVYIVESLND